MVGDERRHAFRLSRVQRGDLMLVGGRMHHHRGQTEPALHRILLRVHMLHAVVRRGRGPAEQPALACGQIALADAEAVERVQVFVCNGWVARALTA